MTIPTSPRRARRGRWLAPVALGLALTSVAAPASALAAPAAASETADVEVIVRHAAGSADAAARRIDVLGGRVSARLATLDAVVATLPADAADDLRASPGIASVVPDGSIRLLSDDWMAEADGSGDVTASPGEAPTAITEADGAEQKAGTDAGSLYALTKSTGVQKAWKTRDASGRRITGKDVGVALIDSGITPVAGLDDGQVVNGPDLSFDSQSDERRDLDGFGHGTHMAGIISGRDAQVRDGKESTPKRFVGVAPDAPLLNLKVGAVNGAVDVSQVIAAIDWVVAHRNDPGLNVRVLNLSFGTNGTQDYQLDPLAYAAEVAWRKGIVVVVSAGNDGNGTTALTNPAVDPFVLAVGASDHQGTLDTTDDSVATFSSRGSATRTPDLVAPGRSVLSLRAPGSVIDTEFPAAVTSFDGQPRLFRGSGTSQAAAFVSGAAALLLQQRPDLTPDQVKALLTSTADPIDGTATELQGAGRLDVAGAIAATTPAVQQSWPLATGTGSLEAARGDSHVIDPVDGTELTGEQDIFGTPWDGRSWALASWETRSWAGGTWNTRSWAGDAWTTRSWAGQTWETRSWATRSWATRSWAGRSWADAAWGTRSWATRSWATRSWATRSWT